MNVLTKKNGVALVAVMTLLMILTLLVPAMLTYADTATSIAVKGTDRQKAAYIARSGVEMAVSAFRSTYDDGNEDNETVYEAAYRRLGGNLKAGESALSELNAETIYLFIDTVAPVPTAGPDGEIEEVPEDYYNSVYTTDYDLYAGSDRYNYVGKVDVKITREDATHIFKVESDGTSYDICCNEAYAADFNAACGGNVNNPIKSSGTDDYSYVKQKYAQYDFVGVGDVNGSKATKKASALDTMNTGDSSSGWLKPATVQENEEGDFEGTFDMIAVNPDSATSKQAVTYYDPVTGTNTQDVLIYSTYGNIIIDADVTYPSRSKLNNDMDWNISESKYNDMVSTMPLYLGCHPGLNYDDVEKEGNLSKYVRCTNQPDRNKKGQSMVIFTATNAIQVNLPVNLTISPIRTNPEENPTGSKQQSIYKMMGFQANDIVFKDSILNFMSFTRPETDPTLANTGCRFGSVLLAATSSTPYSYYNISRGKTVRAGKVTFLEDVYLVTIEYGDNSGRIDWLSSEAYLNWNEKLYRGKSTLDNERTLYEIVSPTEVKFTFPKSGRFDFDGGFLVGNNRGFRFRKMFNKGDVYYFNAEVEEKSSGEKVGLNLAGWWFESYFYDYRQEETNNLYKKLVYWVHDFLFYEDDRTYKADDMHFIGNTYEDISYPPDLSTACYVIWDS